MKITLVGSNLDLQEVRRALAAAGESPLLSPEPIAAAYARISRSPKSAELLRQEARLDVDKARASNRTIVFDMGHASIAEHAVFNFDVEGVSRLALEALEHSRLASYTERSQRYVLLGDEYLIPEELAEDPQVARHFESCVAMLFETYRQMHEGLLAFHIDKAGQRGGEGAVRRDLDIAAKEDARYVLPLAATGQLGMTLNARSLEAMIRRLKGSDLAEIRSLGQALEREALAIAPSLIRRTDPVGPAPTSRSGLRAPPGGDRPAVAGEPLEPVVSPLGGGRSEGISEAPEPVASPLGGGRQASVSEPPGGGISLPSVRLLHVTPGGDALLVAAGRAAPAGLPLTWPEAEAAPAATPARPAAPFAELFAGEWPHARAPRLFELVDLLFEVRCSASCFAQLKRHRMATILAGPYDPDLGAEVPPSIREAGLQARFEQAVRSATLLYRQLSAGGNPAAAYLLTNAHRRTVLFKTNLRELLHVSRLRMDRHAQWEIRHVVTRMCDLVRPHLPASSCFLGGKDQPVNP
jgi:flavin-dependent thymidylate synthase